MIPFLCHLPKGTIYVRQIATSAQKRKWKQRGMTQSSSKLEQEPMTSTQQPNPGTNWRQILFLGVFPIFMSTIVVLSREDLLQDLQAKGAGHDVTKEIRDLRTQRALDHDDEQKQQGQPQQVAQ
jgi:hypothetical protein